MTAFPGATATFPGFTAGHTLAADTHAAQHNLEQAEIVATQTKVGTGASTPTANTVLRSNVNGTSVWGAVTLTTDVTGILGTGNGGTGTTATTGTGSVVFATAPAISNPTITGGGSWSGSPSLTTPTIASFTNAQHNHTNAAGGGKITSSAITSFDTSLTTISNPYKFYVYRNSAWTTTTGGIVVCDTKVTDTNGNYDTSTGKYTVAVDGFYLFGGAVQYGNQVGAVLITSLGKNGNVEIARFQEIDSSSSGNTTQSGSAPLPLVAGDTVSLLARGTAGGTGGTGQAVTYFWGFLVCHT